MTKEALSKGEKKLLVIVIMLVVLIGAVGYGFYAINVNPVVSVPMPAMPSPNAIDVYLKAESMIVLIIPLPAGPDPELNIYDIYECIQSGKLVPDPRSRWGSGVIPPKLTDMQALMAKNAPALAEAKKGFDLDFRDTPSRSFVQIFPNLTKYRNLARAMLADGEVKCASEDWDGGVDRFVDILRLGHDIPRGGAILALQTGISIQRIGRSEFWPTLDHVSGAMARQAAWRLEAMTARQVPYADVLQEEKWAMQASLLEMFTTRGWRSSDLLSAFYTTEWSIDITYDEERPLGERIYVILQKQTLNKRVIMKHYSSYMDTLITNAKKPYPAMRRVPALPADPISRKLLPIYDRTWTQYTINQVENDLLIVSLALRAYNADHGTYPADLKALAPIYLKEIPADPFTAKGTLRYKVTGKSYVLYSVGPDGKDDGGVPSVDGQAGATGRNISLRMDSKGDIVAGVNIR